MSAPRLPYVTPGHALGSRCPKRDDPWLDRCLAPSVDGTELCVRHAARTGTRLAYCTYVIEHDDGGLVACGRLTAARGQYVRCSEHTPSWRVLGIDGGGPR